MLGCGLLSVHMPLVAAERQARLIFTAELPRILETEQGDYAELATIVKTQRQQPIPTFFLFGGDSLGPSTLASFDRGSHIIDILNLLEPDAMGVAKRELSSATASMRFSILPQTSQACCGEML